MKVRRPLIALAVLVGAAATALVFSAPGAPLRTAAPKYVPPRTPWGDPDLQGAYTNHDERFTPLERPADLEGRSLDDIRPAELARLNQQRTERARASHRWESLVEPPESRSSRAWLIVDPADGRIPALTNEARQRAASRAERQRALAETRPWTAAGLFARCLSRGLPDSMFPAIYGNTYEIVQGPGVVAITYEMINEARVVPVDPGTPPGSAVRSYMGYAQGRFEGDTLVVETGNLTGETPFQGSSAQLRITERFIPIAPNVVEWAVTLDDPATWVRPWRFAMNLTRTEERPLEFACHEGNYALPHVLMGKGKAGQ